MCLKICVGSVGILLEWANYVLTVVILMVNEMSLEKLNDTWWKSVSEQKPHFFSCQQLIKNKSAKSLILISHSTQTPFSRVKVLCFIFSHTYSTIGRAALQYPHKLAKLWHGDLRLILTWRIWYIANTRTTTPTTRIVEHMV